MAAQSKDISFQGPLPGDPIAQRELAGLVEDALANLPGPWRVGVTAVASGALVVNVHRADGFGCSVLVDGPVQRTFLYVRDQVVNALQLHVLGISPAPEARPKPRF